MWVEYRSTGELTDYAGVLQYRVTLPQTFSTTTTTGRQADGRLLVLFINVLYFASTTKKVLHYPSGTHHFCLWGLILSYSTSNSLTALQSRSYNVPPDMFFPCPSYLDLNPGSEEAKSPSGIWYAIRPCHSLLSTSQHRLSLPFRGYIGDNSLISCFNCLQWLMSLLITFSCPLSLSLSSSWTCLCDSRRCYLCATCPGSISFKQIWTYTPGDGIPYIKVVVEGVGVWYGFFFMDVEKTQKNQIDFLFGLWILLWRPNASDIWFLTTSSYSYSFSSSSLLSSVTRRANRKSRSRDMHEGGRKR